MPIMVFFTLGLWFAWLTWFKHAKHFNQANEEHLELLEQLDELYKNQPKFFEESNLQPALEKLSQDQGVHKSLEKREQEILKLRDTLVKLELDMQAGAIEFHSLEKNHLKLREQLSELENSQRDHDYAHMGTLQAILNEFSNEPVSNDNELGILFYSEPEHIDDLTQLDQLSKNVASQLNSLGIYRFRQVSLWSHDQFENIFEQLQLQTDQTIDKNGVWQKQAAKLHNEHY